MALKALTMASVRDIPSTSVNGILDLVWRGSGATEVALRDAAHVYGTFGSRLHLVLLDAI